MAVHLGVVLRRCFEDAGAKRKHFRWKSAACLHGFELRTTNFLRLSRFTKYRGLRGGWRLMNGIRLQ